MTSKILNMLVIILMIIFLIPVVTADQYPIYVNDTSGLSETIDTVYKLEVDTASMISSGYLDSNCENIDITNGSITLEWIWDDYDSATYGCDSSTSLFTVETTDISDNTTHYFYINSTGSGWENSSSHSISNLVAYWMLEDVNDDSGNSNDGIANGNAAYVDNGVYGGSYAFDGSDDWVEISDSNTLDISYDASFSCWANTTANAWSTIMSKYDNAETDRSWKLGMAYSDYGNRGIATINPTGSGADEFARHDPNITDGEWHLVAGNINDSELSLWVDGVYRGQNDSAITNWPDGIHTNDEYVRIGARIHTGSEEEWTGQIDECMVWNRSLNDDELEFHYFQDITLGAREAYGATVNGTPYVIHYTDVNLTTINEDGIYGGPAYGDIDNDDYAEFIWAPVTETSGDDRDVYVTELNGPEQKLWDNGTSTNYFSFLFPRIWDYDGDGNNDVFFGETDSDDQGFIFLTFNDSYDAVYSKRYSPYVSASSDNAKPSVVDDWNQDGYLDIIQGSCNSGEIFTAWTNDTEDEWNFRSQGYASATVEDMIQYNYNTTTEEDEVYYWTGFHSGEGTGTCRVYSDSIDTDVDFINSTIQLNFTCSMGSFCGQPEDLDGDGNDELCIQIQLDDVNTYNVTCYEMNSDGSLDYDFVVDLINDIDHSQWSCEMADHDNSGDVEMFVALKDTTDDLTKYFYMYNCTGGSCVQTTLYSGTEHTEYTGTSSDHGQVLRWYDDHPKGQMMVGGFSFEPIIWGINYTLPQWRQNDQLRVQANNSDDLYMHMWCYDYGENSTALTYYVDYYMNSTIQSSLSSSGTTTNGTLINLTLDSDNTDTTETWYARVMCDDGIENSSQHNSTSILIYGSAAPPSETVCGDAVCNGTETCTDCAVDCGGCSYTSVCNSSTVGYSTCGGYNMQLVMTCANYSGFYTWNSTVEYCHYGCYQGSCENVTSDGDKCQDGERTCAGDYIVHCNETDEGIYDWHYYNMTYCQHGCVSGSCIQSLSECYIGGVTCDQNYVHSCSLSSDGSYKWVKGEYCQYGCNLEYGNGTIINATCIYQADAHSTASYMRLAMKQLGFIFAPIQIVAFFLGIIGFSIFLGWRTGSGDVSIISFIGCSILGTVLGVVPVYVTAVIVIVGLFLRFSQFRSGMG